MADTKEGREKQAQAEERRQRARALQEALERADEAEPEPSEPRITATDLYEALETHDYPTATADLVETYGDYVVETETGWKSMSEVLGSLEDETFDSAEAVLRQLSP